MYVTFVYQKTMWVVFFSFTKQSSTPSTQTGPTNAVEGTKYAYIEASGKTAGDMAVLEGFVSVPAGKEQFFCVLLV